MYRMSQKANLTTFVRIRLQEGNINKEITYFVEVLDIIFGELEISFVAWKSFMEAQDLINIMQVLMKF